MIKVIATTGPEPITIDEAKMHLRVDSDFEDSILATYISAARSHCERFTGLSFVAQTLQYQARLPGLEWWQVGPTEKQKFTLPIGPAATITGFADADGEPLSADDFSWSAAAVPTVIYTSLTAEASVAVTYTANAAMLTPDIKAAMLMLLHQIYQSRGAVDDEAVQRVEEAYLRPHRVLKGMA